MTEHYANPAGVTVQEMVDRTGLEMFWTCPRRFYWGRVYPHHGGKYGGLEPIAAADYRVFGKAVAKMIELSAKVPSPQTPGDALMLASHLAQEFVPKAATDDPSPAPMEMATLLMGMTVVWMTRVLPTLLKDFDVVAVEQELVVNLGGGLHVLVRPDLILRRKIDGALIYFEFKTSAWGPDTQSTSKYDHSAQIQLGMMAIKQAYGRVDGALVGVFYKGQVRQGVRTHPFCYGYTKGSQLSVTYKAGWAKTPVTLILLHHDMSMVDYFNLFPEDLWDKQFWSTGLLTESPFIQQGLQEQASVIALNIAVMKAAAKAEDVRQHFNQCQPSLGQPCDFLALCHTPVHPLALYRAREPHHSETPLSQLKEVPLGPGKS